jgi:hypothetical protein
VINEKERCAMYAKVTLELRPEQTGEVAGNATNAPAAEGRLWCPAVLPNGTRGHWFFVEDGSPFICHDLTCPSHGHVVYQCPLHRSFIGRIDASCPAANCEKERLSYEELHHRR